MSAPKTRQNKYASAHSRRRLRPDGQTRRRAVASAYDHIGDRYGIYADGEGSRNGPDPADRFGHADTIVWGTVCRTIGDLCAAGVSTLRVLDAGCGPGTWISRIAAYAHRMGLVVEAVGFDISAGQLDIACRQTGNFAADCPRYKSKLDFLIHDLADPLPWPDGHFHIVLCNYVVLNHLPPRTLPRVAKELCRVANFRVIATVRALASPPTGCIIGIEQLREYHQDCTRGQLKLVLMDGTEHLLSLNLFSAATLEALFAPHAKVMDVRAIDLFLSRFAPDTKWTAILVDDITGREEVMHKLKELEEPLCRKPGWVDHGTHILIVAQPNGHG